MPFVEAEFRAAVKEGYHYVLPICLCSSITNEFLEFLRRNIDSDFDRAKGRLVCKKNRAEWNVFTGIDRLRNFSMVLQAETYVIVSVRWSLLELAILTAQFLQTFQA